MGTQWLSPRFIFHQKEFETDCIFSQKDASSLIPKDRIGELCLHALHCYLAPILIQAVGLTPERKFF
jgi:hypothetical protein